MTEAIDLTLRFEDAAAWRDLRLDRDPEFAIDVIGTIRKPINQWTNDGDQVMRALPGWHVNIRCTDDRDLSALDPFIVTPEQPARVWA